MSHSSRFRRRFQFRLRTLLIGVTLLAVVCWVIVDRQRLIEERDRATEERNAMQRRFTAAAFADYPPSIYKDYERYKSQAEEQRRRADMLEYTLSKQQSSAGQKP
jgi:hypothetical protein